VRRNGLALLGRQPRPLAYDVEQGLVNLADIVKQGHAFDPVLHRVVGPVSVSQNQRVARDPAHVGPGLGVGRVDGVEQRLGQSRCQALGAAASATLASQQRRTQRGGGCSQCHGESVGRARRGPGSRHH